MSKVIRFEIHVDDKPVFAASLEYDGACVVCGKQLCSSDPYYGAWHTGFASEEVVICTDCIDSVEIIDIED